MEEILNQEVLSNQEEKVRKKKLLLLLLLLLLIGLLAIVSWRINQVEPAPFAVGGFPGLADAEGIGEEQLQELAERHIDEMSTMIMIFPEISIETDGITALLWVQNVPTNDFGQNVILRLDGSDDLIYESGVILPGYQINQVELTQAIPSGEHSGIVTLEFYDLEEETLLGTTTVDVRLIVE